MNRQGGDGLQKLGEFKGDAGLEEADSSGWNPRSFQIGEIVEGEIKEFTKTGFLVDIGLPVLSFVPFNMLEAGRPRFLTKFLGERSNFKIVTYNSERSNFVLDRYSATNEKLLKLFQNNNRFDISEFEGFTLNMDLIAAVKSIKDYGIFVSLGVVDALLHINDMNGKPIRDFCKGQLIHVIVNKIDAEKGQIGVKLFSS